MAENPLPPLPEEAHPESFAPAEGEPHTVVPPLPPLPPGGDPEPPAYISEPAPRRKWEWPPALTLPPEWRRPALIAAVCLAAVIAGLMVGRSAFRSPEVPVFEPSEEEEEIPLPVEASAEAPVEIPVAPLETLPPGSKSEVDATDYDLLSKIQGEWLLDLGQRGDVRIRFTNQVASRHSQGGYQIRIYRCESRQLPNRFSLVRVPDGGNFIAFHGERGETRDVFENVEIQHRDLFSFTEATTGRRRYAHRAGTPAPPSSQVAENEPPPAFEGAPTWQEPSPAEDFGDEDDEESSGDERQDEIDNLWKIARVQRSNRQYGPLVHTLDRLLELNPRHAGARRLKQEAQQQLREQNRGSLTQTQRLLDQFADAIEHRDLDRLRDLWGGSFDGETSRYFTQLFRRYPRIKARASLVSVTVEAKNTTGFVASVSIEGREKGARRAETQQLDWRGRLRDGRFASAFP